MTQAARALEIALAVIAGALALSIGYAGWHDASQAFDVWYYHLPFAGRLLGLTPASSYAFSADNLVRFQGFPLLGELLQGLLWRVTGHIEAANLVSVAALFALPVFLWRSYGVPPSTALFAFLAIPLVQIHATSSYVDLPANVCVTMLLLLVHRAALADGPPSPRFLAASALLAAATVNMKFQLVPIAALAAIVLVYLTLSRRPLRTLRMHVAVIALAVPIVFATPLKNAALYGNPVWPVELKLAGRSLPHREAAYESSPRHLVFVPRPVRFLRSVLEIDNRPLASQRRWSIDQFTPWEETGYRMGGFFGAWVLVNVAALAFQVSRRSRKETTAAAVLFAGVTIEAAVVPQSHELRYYLHWMLLLVSLNLMLWTRSRIERLGAGVLAAAAVVVVGWATGWGYLYSSGVTFAELRKSKLDPTLLEHASGQICVAKQPWNYLYAPRFEPGAAYSVREATSANECR